MPHDSIPLVIEPRYPFQKLNGFRLDNSPQEPSQEAMDLAAKVADFSTGQIFPINAWRGRDGRDIWIYHTGNGRSKVARIPRDTIGSRFELALQTMAASQCWSLDAEIKAVQKLRELVTPTAYRYYVLTGSFIETSPRSEVVYMFRKCRPTLALSSRPDGIMRVLAALCLHPIGYFSGTFAGVMVPTDCVIAHLMMMRADEHKFWGKANAHDPGEPTAGL